MRNLKPWTLRSKSHTLRFNEQMKLHEEKKLTLVIRPQHRSTPPSHRRSTPAPPKRSTPRPHHRSSSPPHCRYHHLIVDTTSSALIDADSCYLSTPLEIPERSSCPQDIADSAQKGTDVPSYYPSQYVEKVITIEDFVELEEFLELDDGEQLGDLDSSREVIMEDFLELEEWLDSEKKLGDERNAKRKDLETSLKTSIER